ncbi:MAG: rhodanese-like domain-containing protein [Flavobacterium sp.]
MQKIVFLLAIALLSLSCQSQQDPKIKVLPAAEYKTALSNGQVQLVDVRTSQEFAQGAIPGAVNIDVTNGVFDRAIQQLDKTKPVYIYCRSGARSQTAARKMVALGFTEVIDLRGGYLQWR